VQVLARLNLRPQAKPYSRCIQWQRRAEELAESKSQESGSALCPRTRCVLCCLSGVRPCFWQGTHFEDMESKMVNILGKKRRERKAKGTIGCQNPQKNV